ncbi:cytochrome P450 94A2-like [Phragmites australis]|uniref:cytochrome P450 94A2-like n=1 Tax=Phragmites australis TaxID=29695 RepID=UPI002D76F912|nr:cytochrome P450 94A2-like [Phragmites australis]
MEKMHLAYVLLFLFAVVLLRLRRRVASPAKPRPTTAHCPHPNPVLGNTLQFIRNRRRFFDWYTDLLRAAPSGAIEAWGPFGAGHAVTTASPAAVDHLLRANFASYAKGARFRDATAELIGDGLFAADGRLWSFQRKVASHAFSSRSLRRFADDVLAVHMRRRFLPFLDAAAAAGTAVDLQDALRRFGFDTICHVAFGVESAALLEGAHDSQHEALFAAFDAALEISFRRALTPATWVRRLTKLLDVGKSRRLREAVDVIDGYAMSVVESKEARQRNGLEDNDKDLLSRFMAAMDEEDGSELGAMFPTPEAKRRFLRDVVVSFVLAGKDTTSSALTWFFWLLAANPRCERRVHEEAASRGDGDDLKGMHYLHAAITEAMRLYPPVPFNGRVAVRDDVLPGGAMVRAGWYANYSAYAMGRMEKLWGKDCMEFVPERWLSDGGEFVPVDAARYPVFHAGPRVCLGKEMAYVQMKTVAAAVLRKFRVDAVAPKASMEAPPAYEMTATMKMKSGLWVQLKRREESAE